MCCIFTWLAWAFDATHRIVVFFMACLISASICCLLLTASLAGVAMGYNYSLAEYIDLKETNISVYIKRGVYDDEIADDFDWRRQAGGEPTLIHKDTGVRTGDTESQNAPARRRMGESIFESDDQHKYEGSLMRLTATPTVWPARRFQPDPPYMSTNPTTADSKVEELLAAADSLPGGSKERLKAIEAAAKYHEARKIELATAKFPEDASERQKVIEANALIHDARRNDPVTTTDKYAKYFKQLAIHPGFPGSGLNARKFMDSQQKDMETEPPNRYRDAVFRGQLVGWPTVPSTKRTPDNFFEYDVSFAPTMPTPPTVKPLLVRPMGDKPIRGEWQTVTELSRPVLRMKPPEPKEEVYDSLKSQSKSKTDDSKEKKTGPNDVDYDDSQGLPSRKKRSDEKVDDRLVHTKIQDNQYNTETVDIYTVLRVKIDDYDETKSLKTKQPTEIFEQTEDKSIHNTTTLKVTFDVSNKSISVINNLAHVTSSDKERETVSSDPRKRKTMSESYDSKEPGNIQTNSIWRKMSIGAQEQWHKMISYLDKHTIAFSIQNTKSSAKTERSIDSNQSTFIFKLLPILDKKQVDGDKIDADKTNNTLTNLLETTTVYISHTMTPQTFITNIIQSTIA